MRFPYILVTFFLFLALSISASNASTQSKIIAAVDPTEPWVLMENGKPSSGINIEIIELIANVLEQTPEIRLCPWARCLNMLETGEVDLMVNIFFSEDRESSLYFVKPNILEDPPKKFYINKKRNIEISTYENLYGLTVGHVRGASYFTKFDQDERITRFPMVEEGQLIKLLLSNRIDTFIGTEATVDFVLNKIGKADLVTKAGYHWQSGRKTYIAISRKSQLMELRDELSQVIAVLKTKGAFREIATRTINNVKN